MDSVYLYNALSGSKLNDIDTDMGYHITRLLNFRNEVILGRVNKEEFAKKLLSVIRQVSTLKEVDRICIALQLPLSNKIQIISSATSEGENLMNQNYSCFVSPESSLQTVSKGGIRTFGNINDILKSYEDNNKPVQKSIELLSKMGLKSGLSMKLESSAITGYLFLNSKKLNYFNEILKNYSTYLNTIEIVTKEYFVEETRFLNRLTNLESYLEKFPTSMLHSNAHLIGKEGVDSISNAFTYFLGHKTELQIKDNTSDTSLIPWGQISIIFSILLEEVRFKNNVIMIELNQEPGFINASIKTEMENVEKAFQSHNSYREMRKFISSLHMELVCINDTINLKLELCPVKNPNEIEYSVND